MSTARPVPPPSAPRAALRDELIERAAAILAEEGAAGLSLRRLARDAGTSTMAIYTHFGGMPELRRAIRHEGFRRMRDAFDAVPPRADALAHLVALCDAYLASALAHPDLYREMFLETRLDAYDAEVCLGTFETLVGAAGACVERGALAPGTDAITLATDLWVAGHGVVALEVAGALDPSAAADAGRRVRGAILRAAGATPAALAAVDAPA